MTIVKSNHKSPLGLPRGPVIMPGKAVKVDVPGYGRFLRMHSVGSAWLAANVIEIEDEAEDHATAPDQPQNPAPVTTDGDSDPAADQPKTAAEVLSMADKVHFQTFKAEAVKVLGEGAPSNKAELIAALEERATAPE